MTDPIGYRFAALRARTMTPRDLAAVVMLPFAAVIAVLRGVSNDEAAILTVDRKLGLAPEPDPIPSAERAAAHAVEPDYEGGRAALRARMKELRIRCANIDRECGVSAGTTAHVLGCRERNHAVEAAVCRATGFDPLAIFPPTHRRAGRI